MTRGRRYFQQAVKERIAFILALGKAGRWLKTAHPAESMPLSHSSRRTAFTMLEIVLVIVIIFLLIVALIPAFRGKRAEKHYRVLPSPTPAPASKAEKPSILDLPFTSESPARATPAPEPPK